MNPVVIEDNYPIPKGHRATVGNLPTLRATLLNMKVGQSFLWPNNYSPYLAAKQVGIKVKVHKVDGGYRIWRKK